MKTTAQYLAKYGLPNPSGTYLTQINLPFPMRIAWDKSVLVSRISCHRHCAAPLQAVFEDILDAYGRKAISALGIDIFGGCFNFRAQRGGSAWSVHAWGLAIDLDPERNQLKENHSTARFARPEYKQMIDIFYKHGFSSLGREKDYDWMHFQYEKF